MKLMSFNTQHCRNYRTGEIDFDVMAGAILAEEPDVVGLNEMRGRGEDPAYTAQTERLAALTGMPYFYFAKAINVGGKNPYGNAILSKHPLVSAETLLIPLPASPAEGKPYEQRCILRARLDAGLTVLVTHFGLSQAERVEAVRSALAALEAERCVLMGDFNAVPDDPVLLPLRARLCDSADAFPSPRLSFPSDEPRIKIDYILYTKDLTLRSADIPATVASDHRPHTAEISF